MTFTIVTVAAAYALVVALLAYLLLMSRIHWVLKGLATIATAVLIPMTFNGIGELRGLPSDGPMPLSFRMLWGQVTEPNAVRSERGHVFLWLQPLDKDNFPVDLPRGYQLPYSDDLKIKVSEAMDKITQGEEVQGKIDAKKALPDATSEALAQELKTGKVGQRNGGSATVGERIFQFEPGMLTFTEAAAPVTPAKPK